MSTITTTMFWATHASRWDQLKFRISEWQRRARSRRELEGLSDATLRDIGITRCDAHREALLDGVTTTERLTPKTNSGTKLIKNETAAGSKVAGLAARPPAPRGSFRGA